MLKSVYFSLTQWMSAEGCNYVGFMFEYLSSDTLARQTHLFFSKAMYAHLRSSSLRTSNNIITGLF